MAAPKSPGFKTLPAKADARKTVGLLSEIGGTFTVQKIGILVFGNETASVPIDGWGIDALAAAKVSSTIKTRFNVIPLKLSKKE